MKVPLDLLISSGRHVPGDCMHWAVFIQAPESKEESDAVETNVNS
jgi:hypothetical protein